MKGTRFKVYQDDAGQWRWRLQSANGRILADSGEGYTRKRDCVRAVDTVMVCALNMDRQKQWDQYHKDMAKTGIFEGRFH